MGPLRTLKHLKKKQKSDSTGPWGPRGPSYTETPDIPPLKAADTGAPGWATVLERFGITLGQPWDHCWDPLGMTWDHLGPLGTTWDPMGHHGTPWDPMPGRARARPGPALSSRLGTKA